MKDYELSKKLLDISRESMKDTQILMNKSLEAISTKNEKDIKEIQTKMESIISHITNLTNELHSDELTKVYNRKWLFHEFLEKERFFKKEGTMVFIDLNDFKEINDTYGHYTGDNVLIYLTKYISSKLFDQSEDNYKLIRFAGDEFIIIFENDNAKEVDIIMKKIEGSLKKKTLKCKYSDIKFKINFSYGLNSFKKGNDIDTIMKIADSNMYHMKSIRKRNLK